MSYNFPTTAPFSGVADLYEENNWNAQTLWNAGVRMVFHKIGQWEPAKFNDNKTTYLQRKADWLALGGIWAAYYLPFATGAAQDHLALMDACEPDPSFFRSIDWEPQWLGGPIAPQSTISALAGLILQKYGRLPLKYGSRGVLSYGTDPVLDLCDNWFANPPESGIVPTPIPTAFTPLRPPPGNTTLWQWSDDTDDINAKFDGADFSAFNGSLSDLVAKYTPVAVKPTPIPTPAATPVPTPMPSPAPVAAAAAQTGWAGILAAASTTQTLQRAQQGLGRGTVYQLGQGGEAADIPQPLTQKCDCSGFVCWSIGVPRECPPGSDHWLYTDNIWAGGGDVGSGLFAQISAGSAQPGDFYVYPSPNANEHGHISIITSVQNGVPQQIIHCSLSNYENTNDAVRVTDPHVFEQNSASRIVRPNYAAIQGAAGLAPAPTPIPTPPPTPVATPLQS